MACNRCEQLAEETGCEPKSFCQCSTNVKMTEVTRIQKFEMTEDALAEIAIDEGHAWDADSMMVAIRSMKALIELFNNKK